MDDGRPAAWRATLFHDALCQFRHEVPGLRRAMVTDIFRDELAASDAPSWMQRLYPAAADLLGPQNFPGDDGDGAAFAA